MNAFEELRAGVSGDVFFGSEASAILGEGPSRDNRLSRWVKAGKLSRIARDLYHFNGIYQKAPLNVLHVSNRLFSPSYISLESALSYYGLIPEAVPNVTAVNGKKTKNFSTPIGEFRYRKLSYFTLAFGVRRLPDGGGALVAEPERALLDKLYLDFQEKDGSLSDYCLSSLRVEPEELRQLDLEEIKKHDQIPELSDTSRTLIELVERYLG